LIFRLKPEATDANGTTRHKPVNHVSRHVKGRRLSAAGDYRVPETGEWRTTARRARDEHFEAQVVLHEQAERRSSEDISVRFEPLVDGPGKRSRPA
jgi:hypothetical protein